MSFKKRPLGPGLRGSSPPENKRSRSFAHDSSNKYATSASPDPRRGSMPDNFDPSRGPAADRSDRYRPLENMRPAPTATRYTDTISTLRNRNVEVGSPQQHFVGSPASIHGDSVHTRSGSSTPISTKAPPAPSAAQLFPGPKGPADLARLNMFNQVYSYLKTERNKEKLEQEYSQVPYPPNVSSLRRLREQKLKLAQKEYDGMRKKVPARLAVSHNSTEQANTVSNTADTEQQSYQVDNDKTEDLQTQYDKLHSQYQEVLEKLNKMQDVQSQQASLSAKHRDMQAYYDTIQEQLKSVQGTRSLQVNSFTEQHGTLRTQFKDHHKLLQERVQALELPDPQVLSLTQNHELLWKECRSLQDQVKSLQDAQPQQNTLATKYEQLQKQSDLLQSDVKILQNVKPQQEALSSRYDKLQAVVDTFEGARDEQAALSADYKTLQSQVKEMQDAQSQQVASATGHGQLQEQVDPLRKAMIEDHLELLGMFDTVKGQLDSLTPDLHNRCEALQEQVNNLQEAQQTKASSLVVEAVQEQIATAVQQATSSLQNDIRQLQVALAQKIKQDPDLAATMKEDINSTTKIAVLENTLSRLDRSITSLQKLEDRVKSLESITSNLTDQLTTTRNNEEKTYSKARDLEESFESLERKTAGFFDRVRNLEKKADGDVKSDKILQRVRDLENSSRDLERFVDKMLPKLEGDKENPGVFDQVRDLEEFAEKTKEFQSEFDADLKFFDTKLQALEKPPDNNSTRGSTAGSTGDIDTVHLRAEILKYLNPVNDKQTQLERAVARQADEFEQIQNKVNKNEAALEPITTQHSKLEGVLTDQETKLKEISKSLIPIKIKQGEIDAIVTRHEESLTKVDKSDENRVHPQQDLQSPQAPTGTLRMRIRIEMEDCLAPIRSQLNRSTTSIGTHQGLIDTLRKTISNLDANVKRLDEKSTLDNNGLIKDMSQRLVALTDEQAGTAKVLKEHAQTLREVRGDVGDIKDTAMRNHDNVVSTCNRIEERLPPDLADRFERMHTSFANDEVFQKSKQEMIRELTLRLQGFATTVDERLDPAISQNGEFDKRVSELEKGCTQAASEFKILSETANSTQREVAAMSAITQKLPELEEKVAKTEHSLSTTPSAEKVLELETSLKQVLQDISGLPSLTKRLPELEDTIRKLEQNLSCAASLEKADELECLINKTQQEFSEVLLLAKKVPGLEEQAARTEKSLLAAPSGENFLKLERQVSQCAKNTTDAEETLAGKIVDMERTLRLSIQQGVAAVKADVTAKVEAKLGETSNLVDSINMQLNKQTKQSQETVNGLDKRVLDWNTAVEEIHSRTRNNTVELCRTSMTRFSSKFDDKIAELNKQLSTHEDDIGRLKQSTGGKRGSRTTSVSLSDIEELRKLVHEIRDGTVPVDTLEELQQKVNDLDEARAGDNQQRDVAMHAIQTSQSQLQLSVQNAVALATSASAGQVNILSQSFHQLRQQVNGYTENTLHAIKTLEARYENISTDVLFHNIIQHIANVLPDAPMIFVKLDQLQGGLSDVRLKTTKLRGELQNVLDTQAQYEYLRQLPERVTNAEQSLVDWRADINSIPDLRAEIIAVSDRASISLDLAEKAEEKAKSSNKSLEELKANMNSLRSHLAELAKTGGKSTQDAVEKLSGRVDEAFQALTNTADKESLNELKDTVDNLDGRLVALLQQEREDRISSDNALVRTLEKDIKDIKTNATAASSKAESAERNASKIPFLEVAIGELKGDAEDAFKNLEKMVRGFHYVTDEGEIAPQMEPTPPKPTPSGPRRGRRTG
ncbi:hypothetical protein BDV96DRAFT_596726 [Lophiotrema nucula]|uniref:Uncharacterized protein n=1 Tax=Lophiotrema nucula TaxID=690887 RepID=A0A6A5ZH97_9PLEO|nr:hypothetical protein BDV96DRAFT_596726 [Lophiotrema nucula]